MPRETQDKSAYQLRAIMFTDIVGYSELMGRDEKKTIQLVRLNRKIQQTLVEKYGGLWLKEMGDGSLSSFNTASEAIYCALEIQRRLLDYPDLTIRIGIHLGEVIVENEDIYGDGVNIAARLESIADPGGIYISDTVQKSIRSKSNIKTRDLGPLQLKNIDVPVRVFAVVDNHLPPPKYNKSSGYVKKILLENPIKTGLIVLFVLLTVTILQTVPWKPNPAESNSTSQEGAMVAVLPFSVKGNEKLNYLGEGMVDLISAKLDGMPGFKALDPNIVIANTRSQTLDDRSPEELLNMAQQWGAGSIIMGNIIQFGKDIRIRISVYQNSSAPENSSEIVIRDENQLLSGINQLIKETIAQELVNEGLETEGMTAYTSENIPALKKFLEGESLRREGNYETANYKYLGAIEQDSTLCMAWLRLWQNCRWENICSLPRNEVFSMVQRYDDELPLKLKEYVKAMVNFYNGNPEAEQQFLDLIRTYGENVDFLIGMGEVLYHYNEQRGRLASEALPYFLKAWEYDPENSEVTHHLVELLAWEQDTLLLENVVDKIDYHMDFWYAFQSIRLLALKEEWSEDELHQILNHPSFDWNVLFNRCQIETLLNRFISFKNDLVNLRGEPFPINDRQPYAAIMDMWQGKEKKAFNYLQHHPSLGIIPYVTPLANIGREFTFFKDQQDSLYGSLKSGRVITPFPDNFILALIALNHGHATRYREYFQKMESRIDSRDNSPGYLLKFLNAVNLRNQGDFSGSNEIIREILNNNNIILGVPFDGFLMGGLLFMIAENNFDLGKYRDAFRWYQVRFNHLSAGDEFMIGYSLLRRGEILSRMGEKEEALPYLNRFLTLYKNCDDKYQPWVDRAITARDLIQAKNEGGEITARHQ
jgi:class 3 adenylate cyclase/tetratricopeptide (TPR) repeat protein